MEKSQKEFTVPTINENQGVSFGNVKINHSVVATIVRLAATQVEGVYSTGTSLVEGLTEIFSKKETEKGVRVTEDENGDYIIEVRVVIAFGIELAKVALQIQENVREQVSRMTMKNVRCVDVIIDGVRTDNSRKNSSKDYLETNLE